MREIKIFRAEPDLEFEGLLKRQHTRVKYFQGSLMNAMDLERAKVAGSLSYSAYSPSSFPHSFLLTIIIIITLLLSLTRLFCADTVASWTDSQPFNNKLKRKQVIHIAYS